MKKRAIRIEVIGPVEGADFMRCKLHADGRVCGFYISKANYEALAFDKIFIRESEEVDAEGVINTTNTFIEEV